MVGIKTNSLELSQRELGTFGAIENRLFRWRQPRILGQHLAELAREKEINVLPSGSYVDIRADSSVIAKIRSPMFSEIFAQIAPSGGIVIPQGTAARHLTNDLIHLSARRLKSADRYFGVLSDTEMASFFKWEAFLAERHFQLTDSYIYVNSRIIRSILTLLTGVAGMSIAAIVDYSPLYGILGGGVLGYALGLGILSNTSNRIIGFGTFDTNYGYARTEYDALRKDFDSHFDMHTTERILNLRSSLSGQLSDTLDKMIVEHTHNRNLLMRLAMFGRYSLQAYLALDPDSLTSEELIKLSDSKSEEVIHFVLEHPNRPEAVVRKHCTEIGLILSCLPKSIPAKNERHSEYVDTGIGYMVDGGPHYELVHDYEYTPSSYSWWDIDFARRQLSKCPIEMQHIILSELRISNPELAKELHVEQIKDEFMLGRISPPVREECSDHFTRRLQSFLGSIVSRFVGKKE
jgi:hypothetical protein